jgi:hypothetical protein
MTLRMFTNPVLELDEEMLREAIKDEKEKRETILAKIGIEETALASNDQFANVLIGLGCVPPKKISKTTGKEAYAFAKNDALFQALLNNDNEDVITTTTISTILLIRHSLLHFNHRSSDDFHKRNLRS